ncbi:diguanylate cyclase [Amphritea sp.]|uniref:sensor domain-containing diguanylate cyclase n=1 Tax=Amphritea sp. TaxID=1872502 RepID=UPI003A91B6F9
MKHFLDTISSSKQLERFLNQPQIQATLQRSQSVLVQVFTASTDIDWINLLSTQIKILIPHATVVGTSSGGEIAAGKIVVESTLLSLLCFSDTDLHLELVSQPSNEYSSGADVGSRLSQLANLKGVLLMATPTSLDCARLLEGLDDKLPDIPVFGGGAGSEGAKAEAFIFTTEGIFKSGLLAVGLQSTSLHLKVTLQFGWEALGPRMTLTKVEHNIIHTIDRKPAFKVYSQHFNITSDDELFLLEFPLLIERNGHTLARNPTATNRSGEVSMIADVKQGETARLGYLNVDTVITDTETTLNVLHLFQPDAILLYSCVCRRFFLQQETELETRPFQHLAPTAGLFTYGEFIRLSGKIQLLNSSQVAVALREDDDSLPMKAPSALKHKTMNQSRTRHARITSRLLQFVNTLTEEVDEANRLLKHQAEHDPLTGAFNRQGLLGKQLEEMSRAVRHGHSLSILMLDIDHFKRINDQFGHITGDFVLKKVVDTLHNNLRKHDLLFRYGGEEFVILLPEIDLSCALMAAEKLRSKIEDLSLTYNDQCLPPVTVSIGVVSTPQDGTVLPDLMEAVDSALYRAKENGRNRVEHID